MSDNVEFRSITELSAKVTLDGTEEIQVSPSEKVNLLRVIQANAGRVNSSFNNVSTNPELYLTDNHTDWLIKGHFGITKTVTISSSEDLLEGAEYTLVLRASIGSTVTLNLDIDQLNVQQDHEDPIVKLDGKTLTLLGSGTYIFNIHANTSISGQSYDVNIDCKYTQPDFIIRYKAYNNVPVILSNINENAWGVGDPESDSGISSISTRYNYGLNIGELELNSQSGYDSLVIRKIPSLAFSCYEIPMDGKTGVTTHFLSEVWLPSSITEVSPGAFMGCNYIHKFHGGTPGLVSPDGTQILNTHLNGRVELVAVAPCALGSLVLYPGIGGLTRDEILTFYVDERADYIGDLVFAHMPMSVPIRTVVFGRNVRTIGLQTFFMNECICTLVLGDNFLKYPPMVIEGTKISNRPSNLSRLVCSNHLPNGIFPNEGDKEIEYILSVPELLTPTGMSIRRLIETQIGSQVSGTLPNIMRTSYFNLYPLENEVVYSTYDQAGLVNVTLNGNSGFAYMDREYWLSGMSTLKEATSEPISPLRYSTTNNVTYYGFGQDQNIQQVGDDIYFRGTLDNPHGLDMFFGNHGSTTNSPVLFIGDPDTVPVSLPSIRFAGKLKSIRFPKSLGALGGTSILIGSMDGPLDIYLYSLNPVLICSQRSSQYAPLFSLLSGVNPRNLPPITIHTVKGVPIEDKYWAQTKSMLGDILTFVDDLSIY